MLLEFLCSLMSLKSCSQTTVFTFLVSDSFMNTFDVTIAVLFGVKRFLTKFTLMNFDSFMNTFYVFIEVWFGGKRFFTDFTHVFYVFFMN